MYEHEWTLSRNEVDPERLADDLLERKWDRLIVRMLQKLEDSDDFEAGLKRLRDAIDVRLEEGKW